MKSKALNKTKVSFDYLLSLFDLNVHARIHKLAASPDTTALVVFECQQFDSSNIGKRTVMAIGPERTCSTVEQALTERLGSVPSNFQYPTVFWVKPTDS